MSHRSNRVLRPDRTFTWERLSSEYWTCNFELGPGQNELRVDVFDSQWTLAIFRFDPGSFLEFFQGDSKLKVQAPVALCCPAFSINRWAMYGGPFHIQAFSGTTELCLNPRLSGEPRYWNNPGPVSAETAYEMACQCMKEGLPFSSMPPSVTVSATKKYIQQHYLGRCGMSSMASTLGYAREFLSREFGQYYGISPSTYRNRLRVCAALRALMIEGDNVVYAGSQSGFSDFSAFRKRFTRYMGHAPSFFRPDQLPEGSLMRRRGVELREHP